MASGHAQKSQHCRSAEQAKECIMPHVKPFVADRLGSPRLCWLFRSRSQVAERKS
ncbi:hypothetical protein SS05631_c05490 [Sinorhizobium sp. CCBAU 05631]|nr:hypothetical protein SS05631_c05490 [Sinorhizobium sp. CCBAU 05631]